MSNFARAGYLMALTFMVSASTATVRGDLVSVNSIGTVGFTAGTDSTPVTIGLKDLNPGSPVTMYGWSLGLHIVPIGVTTGTVTLTNSSFSDSSNNIFQGGAHVPGPLGIGNDNPGSGDFTVANSDNAFPGPGVTVPGTTRNLVDAVFHASSDASGTFALQLVDADPSSAANLQNSYWFDTGFNYHYLAVNGLAFTNGASLGTLSITPAAVPEPSSLLLTAAVAAVAARNRRKRLRSLNNAAPANTVPLQIV